MHGSAATNLDCEAESNSSLCEEVAVSNQRIAELEEKLRTQSSAFLQLRESGLKVLTVAEEIEHDAVDLYNALQGIISNPECNKRCTGNFRFETARTLLDTLESRD